MLMGSTRDPQGRVFAQLGDALRRAGELAEAREVLEEGVSEHPHFPPGHLALGWVLLESGEMDAARASFQRTVELDGENPLGLFGLGAVLEAQGDDTGAEFVAQARVLYGDVEAASPRVPLTLASLPFMSLEELAPDEVHAPQDELEALPFLTLAELAPEDAAPEAPAWAGTEEAESERLAADGLPEADQPPEVDELPEVDGPPEVDEIEGLPFMTLSELAPAEPAVLDRDEPAPTDAMPVTRTMAELLASQGRTEQALAVYDKLIERTPGNDALVARRREIAAGDTLAGADAPEAEDELHPALSMSHPHEASPSPFTPDAEDGDEAGSDGDDETDTAAGYFGGLLSWTPPDDGSGSGRDG